MGIGGDDGEDCLTMNSYIFFNDPPLGGCGKSSGWWDEKDKILSMNDDNRYASIPMMIGAFSIHDSVSFLPSYFFIFCIHITFTNYLKNIYQCSD